jgi:hypothetical protein
MVVDAHGGREEREEEKEGAERRRARHRHGAPSIEFAGEKWPPGPGLRMAAYRP